MAAKLASNVVRNVGDPRCPACGNNFEIRKMIEIQLRCPSCFLTATIYVDEGASSIFDKQRQVEKPVAVYKENLGQRRDHIKIEPVKINERKKQESQRKPKRIEEPPPSRKVGLQRVQERRKSRGV
jgi:hypothetical protein